MPGNKRLDWELGRDYKGLSLVGNVYVYYLDFQVCTYVIKLIVHSKTCDFNLIPTVPKENCLKIIGSLH